MFVSSCRIDWYATWPIQVNTWPWPEVKFWPWPHKVIMYTIRRALTRETWWCQNRCSILYRSKVIHEKKTFSEKTIILNLVTSAALTINLNSNLTKNVTGARPELSNAFFRFLPSYHSSRDNDWFTRKKPRFSEFWPLMTSGDLMFDLSKKLTEVIS